MTNDKSRVLSLDFLRGIAIILVISIHTLQKFPTAYIGPITYIPENFGKYGVQLFFVVSGFTMLLTFGKQFTANLVCKFYIRRFFRIVPLYWIAITLNLLFYGTAGNYWNPDGIDRFEIALTYVMSQWLIPSSFNSIVPGGWSIAIEWLFYMIFPVIAYLVLKKPHSIYPYTLIFGIYFFGKLAGKLYIYALLEKIFPNNPDYLISSYFFYWLPNHIAYFGFGMLLYELIIENRLNIGGLVLLSLPTLFNEYDGFVPLFIFLFGYFILSNSISIPIINSFGQLSYSIYLIHDGVINLLKQFMNRIPFEISIMIVCFISFLMSRYMIKPLIEDPFVRLGKLLSQKRNRIKI